jgi:Holliday junction DNA helicase RuvB subunit
MEERRCELIVDKGPNARHYSLALEPFTLVGATTRPGMLTGPLRSRFGLTIRLGYYTAEELQRIVQRSAALLDVQITPEAAAEIARRARGTPRVANRLLRRSRDFAQVQGKNSIDADVARYSLERLEVDTRGLDEMDRALLRAIIEKFGGGPVGVGTLASALSEDVETLEDVYEPFLLQKASWRVRRAAAKRSRWLTSISGCGAAAVAGCFREGCSSAGHRSECVVGRSRLRACRRPHRPAAARRPRRLALAVRPAPGDFRLDGAALRRIRRAAAAR